MFPEDVQQFAGSKVAPVDDLRDKIFDLHPDFNSIPFAPTSNVPVAAACLLDLSHVISEATYALWMGWSHLHYERQKEREGAAVWHAQYYVRDASMRLYVAGEYLAEAISYMLELDGNELKAHKIKSVTSRQAMVGQFMFAQHPEHPITEALKILMASNAWKATRRYRDDWTHDQAPIVGGLGIVFERRNRWASGEPGVHVLYVGGGDPPHIDIDKLLQQATDAHRDFLPVVDVAVDAFREILSKSGFTFTEGKTGIDLA